MRFRLTYVLLVLNLVVFGLFYFLEIHRAESDRGTQRNTVLSPEYSQTDRISISGSLVDEERVLELRNGTWNLTAPLEWKANRFAVERMLSHLLLLPREISFSGSAARATHQDLSIYGLEEPGLIIHLDRRGQRVSLKVGSPTDLGDRHYLYKPDEDRIFVVDEKILLRAAIDMRDLQSHELFDFSHFDVEAIDLSYAEDRNPRVRLVREAESDQWRLESPIRAKANFASVEGRLHALVGMQVERFLLDPEFDPALGGLLNPHMRVTLEGEGQSQTLLVGDETALADDDTPLRFGKIEDASPIFLIAPEVIDSLAEAQDRLRERRVIAFSTSQLNEIEVSSETGSTLLQKLETGRWEVIASKPDERVRFSADDRIVGRSIQQILDQQARQFVSDAPSESDLADFGLADPDKTIRIRSDREQSLLLGKRFGENLVYAKFERAPFVYGFDDSILKVFPTDPLHYRDRRITSYPSGAQMRSFQLKDLASGKVFIDFEIADDGLTWSTEAVELDEVAKVAVAGLLKELRSFRVERFVNADTFDTFTHLGDPIPWRFQLRARVDLPGGDGAQAKEVRYRFTERLSGTEQGGKDADQGLVFYLSQNWIDSLALLTEDLDLPEEHVLPEASVESDALPEEGSPDSSENQAD